MSEQTTITITKELKKKLALCKIKDDFETWEDLLDELIHNYEFCVCKNQYND